MPSLPRTAPAVLITLVLAIAAPAALAAAAPAGCTTAASALVPCGRSLPGLAGKARSAGSVLAGAPRAVGRALRSRPGAAERFVDAHHGTLEIAAWRLPSAAAAQTVLRRWKAGLGAQQPVPVVLRQGPLLALVRYRTTQTGPVVDAYVSGIAATEATQLRRTLEVTPYETLGDAVARAGHVTPKLALQAFALIGGTGPGVPKAPHAKGRVDGTAALKWVLQALPRLTAAQRKAVHAYLVRTFPQSETIPGARAAKAKPLDPYYQPIAVQALAAIETHTGPLGITPRVRRGGVGAPNVGAETIPDGKACSITVFNQTDGAPRDAQMGILAHELAHCMQAKYNDDAYVTAPEWADEGLPEWVGDAIAPALEAWTGWMPVYDNLPGKPLTAMSYDGVGFFGHVADVIGPDALWQRMRDIMTARTTTTAMAATTGPAAKDTYDTWGGSYAQRTDLGAKWRRVNPVAPIGGGPGGVRSVLVDGSESITEPAREGNLYQVSTARPFLIVTTNDRAFGWLASNDGKLNAQVSTVGQRRFCTVRDCSTCPVGTEGTPPFSEPIAMPMLAGLSGGAAGGGTVTFTTESWDRYCHEKPDVLKVPHPGLGKAGKRTGTAQGDPHLATGDGDVYNFMALGEFTLVKSTKDNLEIQERQQRWADSPNDVATNTAVAMAVGRSHVEVDATIAGTVVQVNGHRRTVDADHAVALAGGGRVSIDDQGDVAVRWPDRSVAEVGTITDGQYLEADVTFAPAKSREGKLVGLLGNFNGKPEDDFVTRDGTKLNATTLTDDVKGFALLYGRFANSWRIKQSGSLFTYPHGKSTRTYTIKPFPRKPFSWTAEDQAAAKNSCIAAGVSDAYLLANCSADYSATKQDLFIAGAAARQLAQQATPAAPVLTSDPIAVGKTGYKLSVLAIAGSGDDKPRVTVDLTRADGDNLQTHTYALAGSTLSSSATSARVTAAPQALGQLDLHFVATGGSTFSKPAAGCTGPFTIKQRGVMTGTLVLHADAGYFGTITLKSLPATLSHEQLGAVSCKGPAAGPGDVTLSSEAGSNPLTVLRTTHRADGTELTASSITTNTDGSTVVHTIDAPGLPAAALTASADLSSAQLTGSGPFLAGSLTYTATDPGDGAGFGFGFGTARGDLTLQFDSIGPLQPWLAAPADAQLAPVTG